MSTNVFADSPVRPATPDDVSAIFGFIRELAEYERLEHEITATVDDLQAGLFGPRPFAEAFVACVDDQPVGFALFFHSYSTFQCRPGIYLEDLYVQPAYRGKGLGKALLKAVAAVAVERNCGRYEWSVLDWNEPSIQFYETLGAVMHADWRRMRVMSDALERLAVNE
ncbi:GNAT family N-acetyltransferase [Planctomicrobium piriforme]|uniref:Acetyltransferase (GNAT) family protein n=1 Tax=Planctomicrobium piriforme TaxID=1576369 RepID=A0A1I3BE95_9PLAN|nr:GNAT family N-acetyltransferase [Planctomicrobium piriforme]SFH60480.1 Acetyltransferase (GNAT) family protein [Planctomicrobium piriforme]